MTLIGGDFAAKAKVRAIALAVKSKLAGGGPVVERLLGDGSEAPRDNRMVQRVGRATALAAATGMLYFGPRYIAEGMKSAGITPPAGLGSAVKFFTDFSENDPLKYWAAWSKAGLALEPFENRITALPNGPCVIQPSARMSDGQASFRFLTGSPAEFILRGQNRENCYLLRLERHKFKDNTSYFALQVRQLLKGKVRTLTSAIFQDLEFTRLELQHLIVNMDGRDFVTYLEREVGSDIFGGRTERKVLHTWRDDLYREGHTGMSGSPNPDPNAKNKFRVFSVRLES